jgi:hypothetical protein
MDGYVLTLEQAGADRVRWAVDVGVLPPGFAPCLLDRDVYTALREGTQDQNGALVWRSKPYAIEPRWIESLLIATLAPLSTSAA